MGTSFILKSPALRRHFFGLFFVQHLWSALYPRTAEIVRFTLSGGAGSFVFLLFLVALKSGLGWEYRWAAATAFIPLVCVNFELQRRLVFESADPQKRNRYMRWFFPKQLTMFLAASSPVEILVTYFNVWYLPVQVASIIVFAFVSFGLSKLIFRI